MECPSRCIDPVIKYCQECPWGWVDLGSEWIETDTGWYPGDFDCGCTLGYDQGRPEDEPTSEELEELINFFLKT